MLQFYSFTKKRTHAVAMPMFSLLSPLACCTVGSSVDETPSSPIYGNVSHEEYKVPSSNVSHDGPSLPEDYEVPSSLSLPEEYEVPSNLSLPEEYEVPSSLSLPEEYEVPVSLNNRSSSIDETALAYEVPLRSKSDPLYHTLEPPEI